jgi:glycosyltransferase involved in cell wall biosynthesis
MKGATVIALLKHRQNAVTQVGVDAQFAMGEIRAGLYVHHLHLFREVKRLTSYGITLFIDGWAYRGSKARDGIKHLGRAFDGLRVRSAVVPRRLRKLRMALSSLGQMDVFYHVFGGRFGSVPHAANVYLVPDIIPLMVDYPIAGFRQECEAFYAAAVRHGKIIFVYSEHTKKDVVEQLGVDPGRIVVTPLAAGSEFRPISNRAAIDEYLAQCGLRDHPYILSVGTIEPRKNFCTLIRAFAQLKRANRACRHRLVLAGATWTGGDLLRRVAAEEAVSDDVIFLGYGERLELLYNGAAMFVFPSTYEGFGLPPLEAMACGVPVIASNATSIPEVVGDAALLIDPRDARQICEAMRRVIEDEALVPLLKRKGIERAAQFSWTETARRFVAGIEKAVQ